MRRTRSAADGAPARAEGAARPAAEGWSRRRMLGATGGGLLYCGALGGGLAQLVSACDLHGEVPRVTGRAPSFITPTDGSVGDDFYVVFGNSGDSEHPGTTLANHPRLSPQDWSLVITGLVDEPVTVTHGDLMAAAESEALLLLKTMVCVYNAPGEPLISNGYWRGVPLAHFLGRAGPTESGRRIRITGEDGFSCNLTLRRVMEDVGDGPAEGLSLLPVLLAYELNGEPIPTVHGGPVRLVVSEKWGYKNMKWPRQIEVSPSEAPFGGYEDALFGGDPDIDVGDIALSSRFTAPVGGEAVQGPLVTCFGFAMNGPGEIERVDVSLDRGVFAAAEIIRLEQVLADPELFFGTAAEDDPVAAEAKLALVRAELVQLIEPDQPRAGVWTLWRFVTSIAKGPHEAQVRARGTDGRYQPEATVVRFVVR